MRSTGLSFLLGTSHRSACLAAVALLILLLPSLGTVTHGAGATDAGTSAQANSSACPVTTTPDAASRRVALNSPSFGLSTGDSLTAVFELRATNTTLSPLNVRLNVPSFFAKFPLANGTTLQLYLPLRTIVLTNSSWSSASLATKSKTMTAPTSFTSAKAVMTSELLSIMATAPYGSLTLAFRWQWSVQFASNGTVVTSPWSVVKTTGTNPTTFYPPPYVQLASTSNSTTAIGSTFTAYVLGAISQTTFYSVLEYASTGNTLRNQVTVTPSGNATQDAVGVKILPKSGSLAPATLLDHLRNVCGALLYSITVHAVYAASATVTFATAPSSCGSVTFNGTPYANGAQATVVPSSSAVAVSVGPCAGHTFSTWGFTEGVYSNATTSNPSTVVVSASGTLTANFV